MKLGSIDRIPARELVSSKTGEKFSLSSVLSEALGLKDLFVHHELIPPGRRSSSPHRHSQREEMIWILEGRPTAHEGDSSFELKPGDFVSFLPDSPELHFLENKTSEPVRCLVIASNPPSDETIYD